MKHVTPPSVRETAFNCPHCYAFAHQSWYSIGAKIKDENQLPPIVKGSDVASMQNKLMRRELDGEGRATDAENLKWAGLMVTGNPFLWPEDALFCDFALCNVSLSECFNCKNVSFWIYDRLVYPRTGKTLPANPDLPEEIRADYDEASKILDESPRGAAALMRLAIQKLCEKLGQPGKNLNNDIAALVEDGLDPSLQKALDTVRVIGNNAVHPGVMDLDDDRATAENLFWLLNVIVERMISVPKHIDEGYKALPEEARKSIEERDAKES